MKIVMLNAEAQAGKDTAARSLSDSDHNIKRSKPINNLKSMAHFEFAIPAHSADAFEGVKDQIIPEFDSAAYHMVQSGYLEEFRSVSPRETYIYFIEEIAKKRYGQDVVAQLIQNDYDRYKERFPDAEYILIDASNNKEFQDLKQYPCSDEITGIIKIIGFDPCKNEVFTDKVREMIEGHGLKEVTVYNTYDSGFISDVKKAFNKIKESAMPGFTVV